MRESFLNRVKLPRSQANRLAAQRANLIERGELLRLVLVFVVVIHTILSPCVLAAKVPEAARPFDMRSNLTRIGPLHMSEGVVLIRANEMVILSDQMDPLNEAELSGAIVNLRSVEDLTGHSTRGTSIFFKGASLAALDDGRLLEQVELASGVVLEGRIIAVTNSTIHMKIKRLTKVIAQDQVKSIKSPRAFQFSLQPADRTVANSPNNTTFEPTLGSGVASAFLDTEQPLKFHFTKHHLASRAAMAAVSVAAIGACFVLPMIVGFVTPKMQNNSSSSSGGGSSSSSSSSGCSNGCSSGSGSGSN